MIEDEQISANDTIRQYQYWEQEEMIIMLMMRLPHPSGAWSTEEADRLRAKYVEVSEIVQKYKPAYNLVLKTLAEKQLAEWASK